MMGKKYQCRIKSCAPASEGLKFKLLQKFNFISVLGRWEEAKIENDAKQKTQQWVSRLWFSLRSLQNNGWLSLVVHSNLTRCSLINSCNPRTLLVVLRDVRLHNKNCCSHKTYKPNKFKRQMLQIQKNIPSKLKESSRPVLERLELFLFLLFDVFLVSVFMSALTSGLHYLTWIISELDWDLLIQPGWTKAPSHRLSLLFVLVLKFLSLVALNASRRHASSCPPACLSSRCETQKCWDFCF